VNKIIAFVLAIALMGCASMNDAMTPSAHVQKDDFDGSTLVNQDPVSAATLGDSGWNVLGFDWTSKTPNSAYITVGVQGINNISGVQFNADGKLIESVKHASIGTNYANSSSPLSTRRFSMPWNDFKIIATAKDVKMRVEMINTYNVSKFGPANGTVIVNTKFTPFVQKVEEALKAQ